MNEYYCVDVAFPDVDFSPYFNNEKREISKVHPAHLYVNENEIKLHIFYDPLTLFGEKLSVWISNIDRESFGSFIKVQITERRIHNKIYSIDLSEAKLCGYINPNNYYDDTHKYVVVKIDTVKFYSEAIEGKTNTAAFFLDDKGFRVVEPFYGLLHPKSSSKNIDTFGFKRMKSACMCYKLGKSSFRPEFNFYPKDNRYARNSTIKKEPKIQFNYKESVSEEEATFYGDVVLMLASFFHHIKIDYVLRKIYLPEKTISIKNIEQKNFINTVSGLWEFDINWEFDRFLQASWQKDTIKNFKLLSKAVALFNQSLLVDSSSEFLIRFNIIEVCNKQKQNKNKFTLVLNNEQVKAKRDKALALLLETIAPDEHDEFKKRWQNVQVQLQDKPMKKHLVSFLESQRLNPNEFPVKIDDLLMLRNNIIHGSIDKVDAELLRKANILLYRINGCLILNLMGIEEWKLDTVIN